MIPAGSSTGFPSVLHRNFGYENRFIRTSGCVSAVIAAGSVSVFLAQVFDLSVFINDIDLIELRTEVSPDGREILLPKEFLLFLLLNPLLC